MKTKTYLVTNINIEDNVPYDVELPTIYSDYSVLSEPFLRTQAVNFRDIRYDAVEINDTKRYWTHKESYQSFIMDLIDDKYDDYVKVKVTPMPLSAMVVVLEQSDIDADGVDLAIFMKLQEYLPIDFLIEYL